MAAVGSVAFCSGETWRSFPFPPFPQAPRVRWSLHSRDRTEMWKGSLDAPNIWMYYDIFWTIIYDNILLYYIMMYSHFQQFAHIFPNISNRLNILKSWSFANFAVEEHVLCMYFALEGARLLSSFERNRSTSFDPCSKRYQEMSDHVQYLFIPFWWSKIWCRIES